MHEFVPPDVRAEDRALPGAAVVPKSDDRVTGACFAPPASSARRHAESRWLAFRAGGRTRQSRRG